MIAIATLTLVGPYAMIRPGHVALTEILNFPLWVPILCSDMYGARND